MKNWTDAERAELEARLNAVCGRAKIENPLPEFFFSAKSGPKIGLFRTVRIGRLGSVEMNLILITPAGGTKWFGRFCHN